MNKLFFVALALVASNNAMAKSLECLPEQNFGVASEVAAKAVLNIDDESASVTVTLRDGRPVSGALVASNLGPGALALNEESARQGGIDVTVMANHSGQTFALVSQLHAMSLPQRLACK